MGRGLDPDFHMAAEALPTLRRLVRARYQPQALARRSWISLRRAFALAERIPGDLSHALRSARRGGMQLKLELAHLRRVGDQIDRAASRLSIALVIAALVVGSSIVMTVSGGPTLFGLPAFGFLGFCGAILGGLWLIRSIRRGGRHEDE
jgi:ubiquinone biosynthesis protein